MNNGELTRRLGIDEFREHQQLAIDAADQGDVLLIAPTGSGKSLAFWGVGLKLGGLTLIVSPLRSLIADQARRLEELDLPCYTWNSDVKQKAKDEILHQLDHGWTGFFYTTPESLKGKILSAHLANRVNLAVIDEADCVLRDRGFRTSYAWLGKTLDRLKPDRLFACTATLPQADRDHLTKSLKLQCPRTIVLPVSRENLTISITDRSEYTLTEILDRHPDQSGLIFTATVRQAESLHEKLTTQGHNVALYHGRLSAKQKTAQQKAFMSGEKRVGVATDAFLRGLDKPDIRFIAHYDHPASIEHWLQGFGRAGRDGKNASVYGCFTGSGEGKASREFLINATYPSIADLEAIHDYLSKAPYRSESAAAIGEKVLGPKGRFSGSACLSVLQRFGLARADVNPEDRRRRLYGALGNIRTANWDFYHAEKTETLWRFEMLCDLIKKADDEIPAAIDNYFGDDPTTVNVRCPF